MIVACPGPSGAIMNLSKTELKQVYPFKSNYFDLDGLKYHYLDEGEGEPFLMVHGNPTWSFYYRNLVKEFKSGMRCIVPDHIGCGLSDKPQEYDYTVVHHSKNLVKLVNHLDLDNVTLGVHDWGGVIGFLWAVKNPKKIKRLVVFNTGVFPAPAVPLRIKACRWPLIGDVSVRGLNLFSSMAVDMAVAQKGKLSPLEKKAYVAPYDSWANRVAVRNFVQEVPVEPDHPNRKMADQLDRDLRTLRDKPMSIHWGMQDFCFNDKYLEMFVMHFSQAEVFRYNTGGHYILEDHHEKIIKRLKKFFKKNP